VLGKRGFPLALGRTSTLSHKFVSGIIWPLREEGDGHVTSPVCDTVER
jgi:hypothetical protein